MRPGFRSFFVTAFGLSTAFAASLIAATGCGDDEPAAPAGETDGSADATSENKPKPPGETDDSGPRTRATCIQGCTDKYPTGRTKDDAVEACWTLNCSGPCITGDSGTNVDSGGAELMCPSNAVQTGTAGCDQCTHTSCCTEWDSCFDDNECVEFNACRNGCPLE